MSASLARNEVVKGATGTGPAELWMLWQFAHVTSFLACAPTSQNAKWRLLEWHIRQTAVFSAPVAVLLVSGPCGLAAVGSLRCSVASPWQAWHHRALRMFLAPCAVKKSIGGSSHGSPRKRGLWTEALAAWAAPVLGAAHTQPPHRIAAATNARPLVIRGIDRPAWRSSGVPRCVALSRRAASRQLPWTSAILHLLRQI